MKKITILSVLFFFVITHLNSLYVTASHESAVYDPVTNECQSGCTTYNPNNPSSFDWQHGKLDTVPPDKLDFSQIEKYGRESELNEEQLSYKDNSGTPNINRVKDWNKLNPQIRDKVLSKLLGRQVSTQQPVNGKVVGEGVEFSFIELLKIGETSVNNCISCVYDGKKLIFKHADSVVTSKSASTNIDNFEGFADSFKIEKADSMLSGCLRFDNIRNSDFSIYDDKVNVDVKGENNLTITDCSFTLSEFESKDNGSITINKDAKPKYEIKEGVLKCKYGVNTDKLEAENIASVDIDNCFSCMRINSPGTYFYSDADIRKDFNINIPKESSTYKLCLRKNIAQSFSDYNGLVDFVDKKIELNGIVNYLRYLFRDNQLLSLLSDFVYQSFDLNNKATINLDKDFLFVNDLFIDNKNPDNNISVTKSGYNDIIEVKGTRFAKIHRNKFYPDLVKQYKTDFENSSIEIKNRILAQNGNTKVKILSVNSPDVKKAELFLQNYWNRKQSTTLIEHLE